jgi:hypothetical protein
MISSDLSFSKESLIYQEILNGDEESYSLDWLPIPLPSAKNCYYWQVALEDEKGDKLASKRRQFCVLAKVKVEAAVPVIPTVPKTKQWTLALGYSPLLSIDYLQKDARNNSIRVKGMAWTNGKLEFSHLSPDEAKTTPSFSLISHFVKGTVFDSESFLYLSMLAKYSMFKNRFHLLASWQQLPLYAVQANSKVAHQKQKNLLNMGLGKILKFDCLSSHDYQCGFEFNIFIPSSYGTELSLFLTRHFSSNSSLGLSTEVYYLVFKGEDKLSYFREMQAKLQYIFSY